MTWKETPRAAATMIRRRYQCDVCNGIFDMRHASADEPMPDCPFCIEAGAAAVAGGVTWQAPMPAIGTTKGKAIDLVHKMAEEDYGLTDMNDNQRAGDIAFKPPAPMQTAEREAAIREMMQAGVPEALPLEHQQKADNFWQGSAGGTAETTIAAEGVYKPAASEAKKLGAEPLGILEKGRSSGNMPLRLNVMGAVPASELPEPLQRAQAARGA